MTPPFIQPDRSWAACLKRFWLPATLAITVAMGHPLAAQSDGALLQAAKAAGGQTSGTFTFQNLTGQTVNRLIVVFGSEIRTIDYASYSSTVSGSTVQVGMAIVAPGQLMRVGATVDGKNIRIVSWYWTDSIETAIGTINKGCSSRTGCDEVRRPGTAIDFVTPAVNIQPLQEITYCYYFKTGNAGVVALSRLQATLANVVRMNLVFTSMEIQPPGTLTAAGCTPVVDSLRRWVFTAFSSGDEVVFPSDDGTGLPVALLVPPEQNAYLALVVSNPTEQPITAQAEIHGDQYQFGTVVTPASPLLVYNAQINVPSMSAATVIQSCPIPPSATFFWMSTYAHRRMVRSLVKDGVDGIFQAPVIFEATDFANPGVREWTAPPFFRFSSGVMTYQFDYVNPGNIIIVDGPSYSVNEIGAVLSYYFPGLSPRTCIDGNFF